MKRSRLLPLAGTVAAVTALGVTLALVQPGGTHSPRPLRLAAGTTARDALAPTASGAAPVGAGYTLTGTLPAGRPGDAPAYTLPKGPADASRVAALAAALKAGTPVRDGAGWRAGGLFVSGDAGQSWWFAPCAADTPVSPGERVACAVEGGVSGTPAGTTAASSPGSAGPGAVSTPGSLPRTGSGGSTTSSPVPPPAASPGPAPAPMSRDAVRAAAAPVFAALGLDLADAGVETWAYGGSVTSRTTVGGLEVSGMQTTVQVDRKGAVQGGGGFLATPDRGDRYPLVTAKEAYAELPPRATPMLCPVSPDGKGCGTPQPVQITGAHLGLVLSPLLDGGLALVPAWLFEAKGLTEPLAVVAVQKRFLPEPTAPPTAKPEPGASTEPGGAVPPAVPGSSGSGTTRVTVPVERAYAGSGNALIAVYGDSSSCPHQDVTGVAKESGGTVWVLLEADAPVPNTLQACTDDHRATEVTVPLQAPLGDRAVVDITTNKPVPRS